MRLEKEIQTWLLEVVGISTKAHNDPTREKRALMEIIEFGNQPLDDEIRTAVECNKLFSRGKHPSAYEACRILRSFHDPQVVHGEKNVSIEPKAILRTDLVLRDAGYSDGFVIVEIKRSASAAREAVTELLAYANSFRARHRHTEVFLVLISTSWKPVERGAFRELARDGYPFLPLEYVEHNTAPTLRVRSDLLPPPRDGLIQEEGLLVRSTVFPWPASGIRWPPTPEDMNRVEHIVKVLTNRAQSTRQSGFILASYVRNPAQLFISVASCNPYPVDMFDYEEIAEEVTRPPSTHEDTRKKLAAAWSMKPDGYNDDAAFRVLYEGGFGISPEEHAGSEGNWPAFRERLINDQAEILSFDAYGDLGDRLDLWRTRHSNALAPAIHDITMLPTWHPITWLPLLDSLLINNENTGPHAKAWDALRAGEAFATFIGYQRGLRGVLRRRSFAWTSTQARFAAAWSQVPNPNRVDARVQLRGGRLFAHETSLDSVENSTLQFFANKGPLEHYCFLLGYFKVNGYCNVEHLKSIRSELDMRGLELPLELR